MSLDTQNKVALVIAAHPDDPDFGAGGTAALWTRQGWEFHYLVVTDGRKGTADRAMTSERLVPMRQREQRAAAETLGVRSCTFLDGVDGELDYTREMLGKIVREIRRIRPFAVFTHSIDTVHLRPFGRTADESEFLGFINHRDHRHTGEMSVDAVYPAARDYLNFTEQIDQEGLETHNTTEVFLWGAGNANFSVDITEVLDTKVRALTCHTSQFGGRGEEFPRQIRQRWLNEDGRVYERFLRIQLPM